MMMNDEVRRLIRKKKKPKKPAQIKNETKSRLIYGILLCRKSDHGFQVRDNKQPFPFFTKKQVTCSLKEIKK